MTTHTETYMYCPQCEAATRAILPRLWSGKMRCDACGETLKLTRSIERKCPDCGALLYRSADLPFWPVCPCALPPAQEEAPAPLPPEHAQEAPLQILWDPAPGEMLCVHRQSSRIPADSLLIVGHTQRAAYHSGGQMVMLDPGQTYALFDEDMDTQTIARAIREGRFTAPSIALKINTLVIFFDERRHETDLTFTAPVHIGGQSVQIEGSAVMALRMAQPENLLNNALDFKDEPSVSEYLKKHACAAAQRAIARALAAIPQAALDEQPEHAAQLLRETLERQSAGLVHSVNALLTPRYGIAVDYLDVLLVTLPDRAQTASQPDSESVSCPFCHAPNRIARGSRLAFACAACGETVRWCAHCERFVSDYERMHICDVCHRKID